MKTYRLFFVSVYRFIWNTFLYDISSILLIIIFKLSSLIIEAARMVAAEIRVDIVLCFTLII